MWLFAVSTAVWVFILLPLIVVWVIGLVDIARRDLPRGATAAWILIVMLLPVVGTVAYFLMRRPTEKRSGRRRRRPRIGAPPSRPMSGVDFPASELASLGGQPADHAGRAVRGVRIHGHRARCEGRWSGPA
jgi:hypothetical protein